MKKKLSKDQLELFNLILQNFSTTIKNSVLYATDHPIFEFSIKNFKKSLEEWFSEEDRIDLGITSETILLGGETVDAGSDLARDVADHLHSRGMVAISFTKGIEKDELVEFFKFIKSDTKTIRAKSGVLKNIPPVPHIKIKEIDYSALLGSAREKVTSEEEDIWKSLSEIAAEAKGGKLPESKSEFLVDFLKDTRRSSLVLNKLYREAVSKLEDEETVQNIREAIARVYDYFAKSGDDSGKVAKGNLSRLIARLDPELVIRLFDPEIVDNKDFDLAQEMTRDFSDDFVAEFIESLMSGQDTFNESLLKVFDKLVPGGTKASNVASMVTDKLLDKNLLSRDTLTKLQMSIKEIFGAHPDSDFMSQMYKITVETFIDQKTESQTYAARLAPLVSEYLKAVKNEHLKKHEAELLLNIVWNEDDPDDFIKFSGKLEEIMPDLIVLKDIRHIRNIFELFTEDLRPEQRKKEAISAEAHDILERIAGEDLVNTIISFVPDSDIKSLEDVVFILLNVGESATEHLLDVFFLEKNMLRRNKIGFVLSEMKGLASDKILERLKGTEPPLSGELFGILKKHDPEKARLFAKEAFTHKDVNMRLQALDGFHPTTAEEKNEIFNVFRKEKNKDVRDKAMTILLKTEDEDTINRLFRVAERKFFNHELLLKMVKASGEIGSQGAYKHIERAFRRKSLFDKGDDLRIAAAASLGKLRTDEAMELIEKGLTDRSERVRNMCEIIMKLEERSQKAPVSPEEKDE